MLQSRHANQIQLLKRKLNFYRKPVCTCTTTYACALCYMYMYLLVVGVYVSAFPLFLNMVWAFSIVRHNNHCPVDGKPLSNKRPALNWFFKIQCIHSQVIVPIHLL